MPNPRFPEEEVSKIRDMYANGHSTYRIARYINSNHNTVYSIASGRTHKDTHEPKRRKRVYRYNGSMIPDVVIRYLKQTYSVRGDGQVMVGVCELARRTGLPVYVVSRIIRKESRMNKRPTEKTD